MSRLSESALHRATLEGTGTATSGERSPSIALAIAYHPHLERIGERVFLDDFSDKRMPLSRLEPEFVAGGATAGEPLSDATIGRTPIHFTCTSDGGVLIDMGDSNTILNIGGQRIAGKVTLSAQDITRGVVLAVGKRVVLLLHSIPPLDDVLESGTSSIAPEMIGTSVGLRRVLLDIRNVADTDKHVLLRGETGSGKELVAQAIHRVSARSTKSFVPVNVAAIPKELAVAEFFGANKGSHSAATERQVGYFEQATTGTLFLDEIGDIPSSIQPTLLRALESGEIQPVGSRQFRKVDVRIISATDADLDSKVATTGFSEALRQRLRGYEIWIPPLRERRDDIGLLLARFLREELAQIGESHRLENNEDEPKPWLSASIVAQLIDYDWPGNIRELKNTVGQIVIGNRGRDRIELPSAIKITLAKQPPRVRPQPVEVAPPPPPATPNPPPPPATPNPPLVRRRPADIPEAEVREALRVCRWDLNAASEQLGISRASMYVLKERFSWFRVAGDLKVDEIQQCHEVCGGNLSRMSERLEISEPALKRRIRELGLEFER